MLYNDLIFQGTKIRNNFRNKDKVKDVFGMKKNQDVAIETIVGEIT